MKKEEWRLLGGPVVTATAKSLQSCPTLCDPIDGSPPGSPIPGFSRQEHWSWLPFPSPMHESEKWKWSHSVVSDPQQPHGLQPTRLLRPWDFPGKSSRVGCHCLLLFAVYPKSNHLYLALNILIYKINILKLNSGFSTFGMYQNHLEGLLKGRFNTCLIHLVWEGAQ